MEELYSKKKKITVELSNRFSQRWRKIHDIYQGMRLPKKSTVGNVLGTDQQEMCLSPVMQVLNLGSARWTHRIAGHPHWAVWRIHPPSKELMVRGSWQKFFQFGNVEPSCFPLSSALWKRRLLVMGIVWLRKSWRKFSLLLSVPFGF